MTIKMNKKIILSLVCFLLFGTHSYAQEPQMADLFRKEGKIYVVIGVILIIFAGLVGFLVYLDRKLNKLEKK
jgi:CcmD family protein